MADISALDAAYMKGHELGRVAAEVVAEAEVRALREALEEIEALPDLVEPRGSEGMKPRSVEMGRLIGMQDAALIARRALAPEPTEAAPAPAGGA